MITVLNASDPEGLLLDRLVAHCRATLGTSEEWHAPEGYPSGLALGVIDAIWSIGVSYRSVENVVARYRSWRADAEHDRPSDLLSAVEDLGGPCAFAVLLRNRQRTSTRNGIPKATAVVLGCRVLNDAGISHPDELHVTGSATDGIKKGMGSDSRSEVGPVMAVPADAVPSTRGEAGPHDQELCPPSCGSASD